MKKINLLTPLLSALAVMPIISLASCGCNPAEDETNHVKTEITKDPEVGKEFEFKFTLDTNYSLNVGNSTITFGSTTNEQTEISLSKCRINSTTNTVTVPSEYVTSTEVKLNIISEKQSKIEDTTQLKKVVANFLKSDTAKNMTYEGDLQLKKYNGDISQDPSTWTINSYQTGKYTYLLKDRDIKTIIKYTTYNPQGEIIEPEATTTIFDLVDSSNIGFWRVYPPNQYTQTYTAYPTPTSGLQLVISEWFTYDDYIDTLKYDAAKNSYEGTVYQSGNNKVSFNFYLSKGKESVKAFEIVEYVGGGTQSGTFVVDSRAYCTVKDIGKTTFDKPNESTWTKSNVYTNDEIQYDSETQKYVFHSTQTQFYSNVRIEIKLNQFDSSKSTYLKVNSGSTTSIYKHADDVLYSGSKKLNKGTDWTVDLDPEDNLYYIKINNIDPTQTLYCVSGISSVLSTSTNTTNDGLDVITFYQK